MSISSRISQRELLPQSVRNRAIYGQKRNSGFINIDYKNKRIIVNDGDNDRILIGWQEDGF